MAAGRRNIGSGIGRLGVGELGLEHPDKIAATLEQRGVALEVGRKRGPVLAVCLDSRDVQVREAVAVALEELKAKERP